MTYPQVARVYQPIANTAKPIVHRIKPLASEASIRANAMYLALGDFLYDAGKPYAGPLRQKFDESISPGAQRYLVQPYQEYAQPLLHAADQYGQTAGRHIEPYLFHTAFALRQARDQAQPYLAAAWTEAKKLPMLLQIHAWEPLMELRRTYVDPPVSKMVKAVEDNADGSPPSEDELKRFGAQDQAETEDVYVH